MFPTSAIALFCDDIREEKSGQVTLVGVMSDNIQVHSPPEPVATEGKNFVRVIPRLGIFIRISFDVRAEVSPVIISVTMPDGEEVHRAEIEEHVIDGARATREKGNPIAGLVQRLQVGGLPIKKLGRMTVTVTVRDQTYLAGFLNFIEGD